MDIIILLVDILQKQGRYFTMMVSLETCVCMMGPYHTSLMRMGFIVQERERLLYLSILLSNLCKFISDVLYLLCLHSLSLVKAGLMMSLAIDQKKDNQYNDEK